MNRQNRYRALLVGALSCAFIVGFSDTAKAQTVSVSNSTLNFNNIPSGAVSSQNINVTTTQSTTIFVNTSGSPSWLTVSPSGFTNVYAGTPVVLTVRVNTTSLSQTDYTGTFSISLNGQTQAIVTVNLTVGGASALSSNPSSLSFSSTVGTAEQNIPTQTVTISSSSTPLSYTVTPSTTDGNNWLVAFTTSGNTSGNNTITVGVNPAVLSAANTYSGSILVQSTSTNDSVAIPVTFTLAAATTLSVTPSSLQPFLYQIGGTVPAQQTLMVSSTNNTSVPFTVSMSPQVAWLTFALTGQTGSGGSAVGETFTVNPSGLSTGSYSTEITFTNTETGVSLPAITAQLVVSANPLLQISNNALGFTAQFGSSMNPSPQSLSVTTVGSNTANVGFTFSSDSAWLSATSNSATTPATLTVNVNAVGLAVSTYTGHIVLRPSNGDNYSLTITVTLTVNNSVQLTAGPGTLLFSYEMNQGAPQNQLVQIASTGQSISFSAATSVTATNNCPAGWLTVNTGTTITPSTISAGVNPSGLTPGSCTGTITISYGNGSSISVPVTLNVTASTALLNVSMPLGFGVYTAAQGAGTLQPQYISLGSTDPTTQAIFSASATSNGATPWLFVSSNSTQTPQQLEVLITPGELATGNYTGTITITSPNSSLPSGPFQIPVSITVNPSITVTASGLGSNNTLNFQQSFGGALPAAQTVTLTASAAGASFTTSIPSSSVCSWVTVSPQSASSISTSGTPVQIGVQTPATGALAQGSYPCQFTLNFGNSATSSLTVSATLTVGTAETYTVAPQSLSFSYQLGGSAPASQQITVTGTPNAVGFTVGTTSSGGWLSTNAGSGTIQTPQTITVSVDPTKIAASSLVAGGKVTGSITITAPSISSTSTVVGVTVNITSPPAPVMQTLFNSANINGFGPISPGELITIKGANLGPTTGVSFSVGSNNTVSNTLAGVQVLFDQTPGTPTYVSATQINVIVPWEVAGRAQTVITTSYNNVASTAPFTYNVVSATPAFYTLNSTGSGQAAALNSDYSINGPAAGVTVNGATIPTKPASPGSEIAIYGTGGGVTNPAGTDGTVTPPALYTLMNASSVTATIGGQPATVYFVGAAPGEVTGVFQVNLEVPAGVTGDALAVAITVNGTTTLAGPTISVH